jgi:glutathione synthase/RimK-type ligase-like ATP-grasp enzyme
MSPPDRIWAAEHKLYQLIQAQKCGLSIPRTLVSNEPAAILEAYRTFEQRMIVKPVRLGYIEEAPQPRAIYTSQVLAEHLDRIADAQLAPSIYQELIPKQCDVRVTIVGRRVFAADIWSQEDPAAAIDWRHTADPNLPHTKGQLPESLSGCLLDLMRRLGLHFAAIDLIKRADGNYTFLEVNPNGQWLWLDERLGCDITGAIAAWLAAAGDPTC